MDSNYSNSRNGKSSGSEFCIFLGLVFFTLGFLLAGSAYFYSGTISVPTCNPICWGWPSTEGKVISSTVRFGTLKTPGFYDTTQYTYRVNGHQYTNIGHLGYGYAPGAGKILSVHYNPQKPEETACDIGFNPSRSPMAIILAIAGIVGGIAYILHGMGILGRK